MTTTSKYKTLATLVILAFTFTSSAFGQVNNSQNTVHTPEQKLQQLNITLPQAGQPIASYVNVIRVGNLLFLAGKGPLKSDNTYLTGKLGKELNIEEGYEAARLSAIAHLAVLKAELGNLEKVKNIVKVLGFINSSNDFYDHPKVLNGYSDLMVAVFGEKGKHARSAIGTNVLPFNMAVEVEVIVEVED